MVELDLKLLLQSPPGDVAVYYRKIITPKTEDDITIQLFRIVENDLLPPTVVKPWLTISKSPKTIVAAIRQNFSADIRTNAIKRLSTCLKRGQNWVESWAAIGGTEGIIRLMEELSINHTKMFLRLVVMKLNGMRSPTRQIRTTEILKGLLPNLYPESPVKSTDLRPLIDDYALLVPSCTAEFVDDLLYKEDDTLLKAAMRKRCWEKHMMKNHRDLLRKHCMESIFDGKKTAIQIDKYLDPLLNGQNYNSAKSDVEGYSESMLFCLQLLKKLIANPDTKIPGFKIISSLIEPLLHRAEKRDFFTPSKILDLIDLALIYFDTHPNETEAIASGRGGKFMQRLVKFWNIPVYRHASELRIIKMLDINPASHVVFTPSNIGAILPLVDIGLRYRLLRLLWMHCNGEKRDVDTLEGLKALSTTGWSVNLFVALEYPTAVALLKRLIDIYGDDDFFDQALNHDEVFNDEVGDRVRVDSKFLLFFFEFGEKGTLDRVKYCIEEHKKRVNKTREQTERAAHARNVLRYGLVSRHTSVYAETLKWCERFVRDPLTVKTLFGRDTIGCDGTAVVLSGTFANIIGPQKLDLEALKPRLEALHKLVLEGNKVIFRLFELACIALKEPSFHQPDWRAVLKVLGPVIVLRLACAKTLHYDYGVPDELLYKLFWENALELSIRIEALCLKPEYEKLDMRSLDGSGRFGGSLAFNYSLSKKPADPASTFRFFEELAKARDTLWKEHRRSLKSSAAVIPVPLPLGLPIQCVYPVDPRSSLANEKTPYITSRAKAIVFAGSEALEPISEDEELLDAIGGFVDQYKFALQVYVTQAPTQEERQARSKKAWRYAVTKLSPSMIPEEAHRRWRENFLSALPEFKIPDPDAAKWKTAEYPILNFEDDGGNFTEWDALDQFRPIPAVKARVIEPVTWLDCSVYRPQFLYFAENSPFIFPKPETIAVSARTGDLWKLERLTGKQTRQPEIREGFIVSALQYLELRLEPSDSNEYILQQAFPLETDFRYPALWLDEEKIDKTSQDIAGPLHLLRCLSDTTPPNLLLKLTDSAFNKLVKTGPENTTAQIGEITYRLLSLLSKSDRPYLASQLILDAMIKLPSASSWHRQLLSKRFLNNLLPHQAKEFIRLFDKSITDSLAAQQAARAARSTPGEGDSKNPAGPSVKISTVKYLAQVLKCASFVPAKFSIQILEELFLKSRHIDVRVAIVDSMVAMLTATRGDDTTRDVSRQLITALQNTVPIASRVDENIDTKWKELGPESELPEAFDIHGSNPDRPLPVILEAVCKIFTNGSMGEETDSQIMELIILPILRGSISSNTSWLELFTAKYDLDFHALKIPSLPVKPVLLEKLIEHQWILTGDILRLYYDFRTINISPPKEVVELNKRLRDDPKSRNLAETRHWLSLYGQGTLVYAPRQWQVAMLPARLINDSKGPINFGLLAEAQGHFQKFGEELLFHAPNEITEYLSPLSRFHADESLRTRWDIRCLPILSHFIAKVESLRTPAWQRDPARTPNKLPDTLVWKTWILPYPKDESNDLEIEDFVAQFRGLLEEITANNMPYHTSLPAVQEAVREIHEQHEAQVACLLGTLHNDMTLSDWLGVEIAADLFQSANLPPKAKCKEDFVAKGKAVLKTWRESEVEWVRKLGSDLVFEGNFAYSSWAKAIID